MNVKEQLAPILAQVGIARVVEALAERIEEDSEAIFIRHKRTAASESVSSDLKWLALDLQMAVTKFKQFGVLDETIRG